MKIAGKDINLFGQTDRPAATVYLHTVRGEGYAVWEECLKMGAGEFTLVEVSGVDWNDDLSPWPIDKLFADDEPCGGKAGEWLAVLTGEVIPQVEAGLPVSRRIVAGYSLAGLFALWSTYNTDVFSGVVSGSGSLWYPGFIDYARSHPFCRTPEAIYLSLGDRERFSQIKLLTTVEDATRNLYEYYRQAGINTAFELNPGNHFRQGAWRMARGISWMLRQGEDSHEAATL